MPEREEGNKARRKSQIRSVRTTCGSGWVVRKGQSAKSKGAEVVFPCSYLFALSANPPATAGGADYRNSF